MSNHIQSIDRDCLASVSGGVDNRLRNQVRPHIDGVSPTVMKSGDIDAPLYGSRGKLNPQQTKYVNAAYEARKVANDVLGRGSNSGAVESVQMRAMIEHGYDY